MNHLGKCELARECVRTRGGGSSGVTDLQDLSVKMKKNASHTLTVRSKVFFCVIIDK